MSVELKIKSKHLALEPAIIREEEEKLQRSLDWHMKNRQIVSVFNDDITSKLYCKIIDLKRHRVWDVRNEARATYLARAFLFGTPYKDVEPKVKDEYVFKTHILPRVFRMVEKYNPIRYKADWEFNEETRQTVMKKTTADKAKEDVLKWINQ